MFESAESATSIDKEEYKREEPKLREALLDAQYDLLGKARFPGDHHRRRRRRRRQGRDGQPAQRVDGPAPHPDPRLRRARPTRSASARRCGASGGRCRPGAASASSSAPGTRTRSSSACIGRRSSAPSSSSARATSAASSACWSTEGALVLKFWFHLSKDAQRKRLKELAARQEDRLAGDRRATGSTSSSTTSSVDVCEDAAARDQHGRGAVARRSRAPTRSTGRSPSGKLLLEALRHRLDAPAPEVPPSSARAASRADRPARTCSTPSTTPQKLPTKTLREELDEAAGAPEPAHAPAEAARAFGHRGVRGHGRRGQGRHHPARHARAGRAPLPGDPGRRAHRGGARAALPVALLAAPPAARAG